MVKLNRIYTGGGDQGKTSLGTGERVAKSALRVETYGAIDETNSCLGLARAHLSTDAEGSFLDELLAGLQNDLFDLGADLCIPEPSEGDTSTPSKQVLRISEIQVKRLEFEIDRINADLSPLNSFILPGGSLVAAHLHLARTVARRAERRCVALTAQEKINQQVLIYLNRLSDLLFVLARHANKKGQTDPLWVPGAHRNP